MKRSSKKLDRKAKAQPAKQAAKAAWKPKKPVLIMRACNSKLQAFYKEFQYPKAGLVEAPDWSPAKICGQGLHGWLWGEGDIIGNCSNAFDPGNKWLVIEACATECVSFDGKVKFRRGNVLLVGDLKEAAEYVRVHGGEGKAIVGATATAGVRGTATAGVSGTATAGVRGTATAGDSGTATAGVSGTATAGYGGTISIQYHDPKRDKYRVAIAEVGENGIEPDTAYVLDANHKFVEAPVQPKKVAK